MSLMMVYRSVIYLNIISDTCSLVKLCWYCNPIGLSLNIAAGPNISNYQNVNIRSVYDVLKFDTDDNPIFDALKDNEPDFDLRN